MDGFILTTTPLNDIRGAKGKTWEELGRDYHVMEQTVSNVTPLLVMPAGK
jgi:homoserine trans-succinylase